MPADRTLFLLNLMFGNPKPFGWQINHLSPLRQSSRAWRKILLAVRAALDPMDQGLVWSCYLMQAVALMARLPSGFLAALLA